MTSQLPVNYITYFEDKVHLARFNNSRAIKCNLLQVMTYYSLVSPRNVPLPCGILISTRTSHKTKDGIVCSLLKSMIACKMTHILQALPLSKKRTNCSMWQTIPAWLTSVTNVINILLFHLIFNSSLIIISVIRLSKMSKHHIIQFISRFYKY